MPNRKRVCASGLAIFFNQCHNRFARMARRRCERHFHALSGRENHALAQAETRIEHRAGRCSLSCARVLAGLPRCGCDPENSGDRFQMKLARRLSAWTKHAAAPNGRVVRRTQAAPRQQALPFGQHFGLNEQFGERRMRAVGVVRREHNSHERVTSKTRVFRRVIAQIAKQANFGVVFGRNENRAMWFRCRWSRAMILGFFRFEINALDAVADGANG